MSDIKMIDKYQIVDVVGEWGMGKVYRAVHPTLKKDIVIKRLNISGKRILSERFRREARIMMDFHHESIVSVYDHFKSGQSYYIVMEYVDGISLEKLIEKKTTIPPLACALIFREICKGLKYAHDKGVIHRDIKPSNILISREGEVKLFDFGIAALEEDEEEKDLTHTGMMMGTPSYMSPEQLADAKRVDKRSDIYSLGVLLYQMLTGKRPFPSNFSAETIRKITKGKYEKPNKLVPGLPPFFQKLIRKTMHHKISHRFKDLAPLISKLSQRLSKYKTQEEIHTAIKAFLEEAPGKESAFARLPRSRRSKRWLLVTGLLTILALGGFSFFVRYSNLFDLYYELFQVREVGAVEVRVEVPANFYKPLNAVFAEAVFIPLVPKTAAYREYRFRLNPAFDPLAPLNTIFGAPNQAHSLQFISTQTLYLPAGNYKLEVLAEQTKYTASFWLKPLMVQKQQPDSPERRKIFSLPLSQLMNNEVPVKHIVRDAAKGNLLTAQTKILYSLKDGWKEWQQDKDLLRPGAKCRFRYECANYFPHELEVSVEPGLAELKLEIMLEKVPGQLNIASETPDLEIFLDNNREYYGNWPEKSLVTLGKTDKKLRTFQLAEGDYVLTLKKDAKTLTNFAFSLLSGEILTLTASYNQQEERIVIKK